MEWRRAFISDLHTASPWAPWPEDFYHNDGRHVPPSSAQIELNGRLFEFYGECKKRGVTSLQLVGDLPDGTNYKGKPAGKNRMVVSMHKQKKAALMLLKPLTDMVQDIAVIKGTPYHGSVDMDIDAEIAQELGAEYKGALANTKVRGTPIHINWHHGAGAPVMYGSTRGEKEVNFIMQKEAQGLIPVKIDIVLRAHLHEYYYLKYVKGRSYIQLPSWAAWIPYKPNLVYYGKNLSEIGGVIGYFDDTGKWDFEHFLWKPPHISDAVTEF